ncbi:efflux transporter outer membrane subunit [Pacificimonas flava]|uniref:Outer membrane component of tripartite multidrug resistance system n=1 Tax=Pacificimonas flava TaxID=1234595 RepID=M2SFQ7_9SPHN|nr:efflux transporter outer membrane subunit [Pacificimonas flava]EMD84205.1 Outer membrane component of tripartite multidrug resistance system [Pacificimonas flava]MBB5279918.1 NodT family efflux transporter outer membrane factor (OMF) lipoprotein [Pacificimonas flava]
MRSVIRAGAHAAALAASLLASCAAPDIGTAVVPVSTPTLGLGELAAPRIDEEWWRAFGDPQLNAIMAQALSGSPRIDEAMARLRAASAQLDARRGATRPQISGTVEEQRIRLSDVYTIPPPYGGSTRWVGQAAANLSWNLDFWGRHADAVRQAAAGVDAAALDAAAARLALTGAVVQSYVELVRAERQIAIARDTLGQRRRSLQLTQVRIESELASEIDARAAETVLAQARRALVQAEAQRALVVHTLAELAGQGAGFYEEVNPARADLEAVLPLPQTLPADLLSRRPDVLSARARVEAARAGRQVARKAFYPNIDLIGIAGLQAVGLGNLFSDEAATYGAGAAVHLPIFEGGRLRADYEGATAGVDRQVALYNAAVLGAVREAADALADVRRARAELTEQAAVVAGLKAVRRLDNVRVETGLSSRLELIGSDVRLLDAEQQAANLQADAALSAVRLVVAMGGSFDTGAQTAANITAQEGAAPETAAADERKPK